jgi:hypothetical protein
MEKLKRGVGMTKILRYTMIFVFFLPFFLSPATGIAQYRKEFTPRISVGQEFDDNIYLDNTDEKSDYITTASPGFNLKISSLKNFLTLDYSPTWVWYNDYDENDTVRHTGSLHFSEDITQHLRFSLSDTYTQSEQPIETAEHIEGIRNTRNTYKRNNGSASIDYQFGSKNNISIGYAHSLLENEDITLNDGKIQNPSLAISYWVNVKNSLELTYNFTDAAFSRDDNLDAEDDYTGNATGINYTYFFTPHKWGSMRYRFTNRNFDGLTEDYSVHEGSLGFGYEVSNDLSLTVEGGIFNQVNTESDDEIGYNYTVSLINNFRRGSFRLAGSGGWDEYYLEAERRGFVRFWSADTRIEYLLMKYLSVHAGAAYRHNKFKDERRWRILRGSFGFNLDFLRWFSLSLDYKYVQQDDDVDLEDFKDNRIMLSLTAKRLLRW